jgi:hypothetical protein
MKVEIKNVKILSVLFSALPLAIYIITFLNSLVEFIIAAEGAFSLSILASAMLRGLVETFVVYVFIILGICVYNFISSLGVKGVRVELEDVE